MSEDSIDRLQRRRSQKIWRWSIIISVSILIVGGISLAAFVLDERGLMRLKKYPVGSVDCGAGLFLRSELQRTPIPGGVQAGLGRTGQFVYRMTLVDSATGNEQLVTIELLDRPTQIVPKEKFEKFAKVSRFANLPYELYTPEILSSAVRAELNVFSGQQADFTKLMICLGPQESRRAFIESWEEKLRYYALIGNEPLGLVVWKINKLDLFEDFALGDLNVEKKSSGSSASKIQGTLHLDLRGSMDFDFSSSDGVYRGQMNLVLSTTNQEVLFDFQNTNLLEILDVEIWQNIFANAKNSHGESAVRFLPMQDLK